MFVKVCGITRAEDAAAAVEAGVSAIGFVFWSGSPRWIPAAAAARIATALPATVQRVGVFVNQTPAQMRGIAETVGLDVLQLHGDETPDRIVWWPGEVWRAAALDEIAPMLTAWPASVRLMLDAVDRARRGGTGRTIAWDRARMYAAQRALLLAGGLTPDNVAEAVRIVRPWGVDVSSGVETAPGIKDPARVRLFVAAARAAGEAV